MGRLHWHHILTKRGKTIHYEFAIGENDSGKQVFCGIKPDHYETEDEKKRNYPICKRCEQWASNFS